jgi:glycerol uptake facilitator protein
LTGVLPATAFSALVTCSSMPRRVRRPGRPGTGSRCYVGLGVASYSDPVGAGQAFAAEFVGTFILVFTIFGVIHRKASAGFAGVAIDLVVFAAIIPVAPGTGASINPARTFGPMLVQQIAGGTVTWEQLPAYWGAELLAGVLAALAYGVLSRTRADVAVTATPASVGATPVPVGPDSGPPHQSTDDGQPTFAQPAKAPRS